MQIEQGTKRLDLPSDLRSKLQGFQKRVWSIKSAEAVFAGAVTLTIAFLILFLGDRLGDTPKEGVTDVRQRVSGREGRCSQSWR